MEVHALRRELKDLIVKRLRLRGTDPTSINDDDPLLKGSLGLDSIDVLELVLAVEQVYAIKISDEQLEKGAFHSIAALAEFVRTHRCGPEIEGRANA